MVHPIKCGLAIVLAGGLFAVATGGCAPATPAQRLEQEVGVLRSAKRDGGLTDDEFQQAKQVALDRYAREQGIREGHRDPATPATPTAALDAQSATQR